MISKQTKMIIVWWIILVLFYYRNPNPFRLIKSGEKIVDEFEHCVNNSYYAPSKYYIRSSGSLLLITSRKTYRVKPGIKYMFSLVYKNENKCSITMHNNGDVPVMIKKYYVYPPIWKRILYIIARYGNMPNHEVYWE